MRRDSHSASRGLEKAATGIHGLDEITGGGLPKGRPTLICGAAGCGKTLTALEFVVRGATQFKEPGVFMAFEESEEELIKNVQSLGFDLAQLVRQKKVVLDYVRVERKEIEETGEYDLEGLFVRLDYSIKSVGAKRVVLDTLEALFAGLSNEGILRAELRRLFRWLKDREVTAIITGEKAQHSLTRYGLEEYVADCVIVLDHRVINQLSTRRLRVVKYRGSFHGTNEYPFLIGESGISVLPITSLGLEHSAPMERVSSGVPRLDDMLGGAGFYRGGTALISGTAGVGKTSLAAAFALAACRRKERVLFFAFEESAQQILRNMRSAGMDLAPCVKRGLLHIHSARPSLCGLEMHLLGIQDLIDKLDPQIVIVDPITNLIAVGDTLEVRSMLTRLIDFLKARVITTLFTSLTNPDGSAEDSEVGISSLIDAWISLRNLERGGERTRALQIIKSRGMSHSNQVREFHLSDRGIQLVDVFVEGGEVLVGSGRVARQVERAAEAKRRKEQLGRLHRSLERKRRSSAAQMAALVAQTQAEIEELERQIHEENTLMANLSSQLEAIRTKRMEVDAVPLRAADLHLSKRRLTRKRAAQAAA